MLAAGVAIAAIRRQLARLAIIDPFLLLSFNPSLFISLFYSATHLWILPPDECHAFYPSSMHHYGCLPAKFLEPLDFFQGLVQKCSKPSIYSPSSSSSPITDDSNHILTMSQGFIAFPRDLTFPRLQALTVVPIPVTFRSREEIMLHWQMGPSYYLTRVNLTCGTVAACVP